MRIYDIPVTTISGQATTLDEHADSAMLIVNVASRCGLTPQYEGLERLQQELAERGLVVLGFPSNQFAGQEPGSDQEIATFCSATYGVTFPMFSKIDVNGPDRHPLYEHLTVVADADGQAGDIAWNFEKFLVAPGESEIRRFRPMVEPDAAPLRDAIEAVLPR